VLLWMKVVVGGEVWERMGNGPDVTPRQVTMNLPGAGPVILGRASEASPS
jgi:hypothetical protein